MAFIQRCPLSEVPLYTHPLLCVETRPWPFRYARFSTSHSCTFLPSALYTVRTPRVCSIGETGGWPLREEQEGFTWWEDLLYKDLQMHCLYSAIMSKHLNLSSCSAAASVASLLTLPSPPPAVGSDTSCADAISPKYRAPFHVLFVAHQTLKAEYSKW